MPESSRLPVTVVYAGPERLFRVAVEVAEGATVADAIACSGIREQRPDIVIRADRIGIFSRKVTLSTRLHPGDRVEIYRPLKLDPKEARRQRARSSSKSRGDSR